MYQLKRHISCYVEDMGRLHQVFAYTSFDVDNRTSLPSLLAMGDSFTSAIYAGVNKFFWKAVASYDKNRYRNAI